MRRFDWTRLAYLLFVLTALTILVRMGDSGAKALSLYSERPDADERREPPDFKQWSGKTLSDLEDARGEVGASGAPKVVEPRVRAVPATDDAGAAPAAQSTTNATESPGGREAAGLKTRPPVFYRPPRSGAASPSRTDSGPVCGDLGRFPESSKVVFPLEREYFYSYEDTWGAARPQGGHEGTDLMTPAGVPEYAVTAGTVVPVAGSNGNGWNTLGGYAVMVRADYSIGPVKKGDLFYYAHLERESSLPIGTRVRAGQVVGYAGDTGQGPEVTRGLFPPHLHLGWYDGTGGRSDVDSGAMNPYPLLEWIKSNGGAVSGGSDARYCEALGSRPSGPDWPDQNNPGVRPDIDTDSDDPRPSPVLEKDAKQKTRDPQSPTESPTEGRTKKPERPNRADEPSKKKPNNDESKRPDKDRPDKPPNRDKDPVRKQPDEGRPGVQRPEKPQKPKQPGPGQYRPNPPVTDPPPSPKPPPSSGPDQPPDPPPSSDPPGPPGENQPDPPCDSGSPKPDSSSSQYDCATGASSSAPDETPAQLWKEGSEPEAQPAPNDKSTD